LLDRHVRNGADRTGEAMNETVTTQPTAGDPFGLISGGEGVITGTVVCAAVIAATAGEITTTSRLLLAITGTVGVYWLAHLHARALGGAIAAGHHPLRALNHALVHTWPIAAASLLPSAILLVAELLGAELITAAWISLWATVALLGGYSYVAGRRGGLGRLGSLACATAGAALGLVVAILKAALH
jgi:hypothetical protein